LPPKIVLQPRQCVGPHANDGAEERASGLVRRRPYRPELLQIESRRPVELLVQQLGFGKEPEYKAAEMMNAFTAPRGFEPGFGDHPPLGFNNPNPPPGSDNHGYELWGRVKPGIEAADPIVIKEIPAASYAVTQFTGLPNIGRIWK
jgi:hypothetical protein